MSGDHFVFEANTDDSVKASFFVAEDSDHQYSKARTRRTDNGRKLIDQGAETNEGAENEDNIEATISEDLADGYDAKLDASLHLLTAEDGKLRLPTDKVEEDEIHIIENDMEHMKTAVYLQDYQRQLMLLEQQNKKRLLQARNGFDLDTQRCIAKIWREAAYLGISSLVDANLVSPADAHTLSPTVAKDFMPHKEAEHFKKKMSINSAQKKDASRRKRQKLSDYSGLGSDQPSHLNTANNHIHTQADVQFAEVRPEIGL